MLINLGLVALNTLFCCLTAASYWQFYRANQLFAPLYYEYRQDIEQSDSKILQAIYYRLMALEELRRRQPGHRRR